eukprot:CAMPEP_0170482462 /NCGR_PEP_ID=MMETSP0208-20121228/2470_1 /TAXON_ID=197538 /ORGANISM="Strombidium inclinatum, Strain S3" /LENGTH=185 /DNA_ID=CAMNT_0010755303 /DNA_START=280 /DNA_END=837 /DNA_ORIENTATION=+
MAFAFLPHLARCLVGFSIFLGIPKTHDIIKNASFPANERLKVNQIFECLVRAAKDAVDNFTEGTKRNLYIFFGLTILCGAIDLMCFLAAARGLNLGNHPYSDTTLMATSTTFVVIDFFYLLWINSFSSRVPPYLSAGINKASLGAMDKMYETVGSKLDKIKKEREANYEKHRQEMEVVDLEEPDQ